MFVFVKISENCIFFLNQEDFNLFRAPRVGWLNKKFTKNVKKASTSCCTILFDANPSWRRNFVPNLDKGIFCLDTLGAFLY